MQHFIFPSFIEARTFLDKYDRIIEKSKIYKKKTL